MSAKHFRCATCPAAPAAADAGCADAFGNYLKLAQYCQQQIVWDLVQANMHGLNNHTLSCCGGSSDTMLEVQSHDLTHSTAQHSTAQHSAAQHSTAQHSAAQHSTAQHSTAQRSAAQHSTAQHSTAQHSTAQHSTAQHRICYFTAYLFHQHRPCCRIQQLHSPHLQRIVAHLCSDDGCQHT
jgi:type IV secretory pathway VirB6-like protein